ncbi:uncharacterized protein LOC110887588 [Helianthus annuus]|uniref:uncharacterized protein LOC110887588 n=1 Tax=Helianthus annuus TaxID=4232 RepID=UPI000B8F2754|nr:uncharacterized protein LOC110887588 [Helianthus annuus]
MEALSYFMFEAISGGLIKGIELPNGGPVMSHLMYADDVVFMGEWSENTIMNLVRIMRGFNLISGLKISHKKSHLFGIDVDPSTVQVMANNIHCKVGSFPCKYLGLLVGANMNQARHWSGVIEILKSRLSNWKASTLSIGGRITLLKFVLDSLPLYFFSLYKAPIGVLDKLEVIRRRFFLGWG